MSRMSSGYMLFEPCYRLGASPVDPRYGTVCSSSGGSGRQVVCNRLERRLGDIDQYQLSSVATVQLRLAAGGWSTGSMKGQLGLTTHSLTGRVPHKGGLLDGVAHVTRSCICVRHAWILNVASPVNEVLTHDVGARASLYGTKEFTFCPPIPPE